MSQRPNLSDVPDFTDVPDPLAVRVADQPSVRSVPLDATAPNRASTRRRRLAALALSSAWLAAHLLVFGVRSDFASLPGAYVFVQVGLPWLLALAALALALRAGRFGLGARIGAVAGLAGLGPLAFWAMAAGAPSPHSAAPGDASLLGVLVCLDITLAWIAVPLLAAALCLRCAFPAASSARSALVGAACGLLAGGVMNLHCPNVDRIHMSFGHGIPVLVAVLVGAIIMSRSTRA